MILKILNLKLGAGENEKAVRKWTIIDGIERATFNETSYKVGSKEEFDSIVKEADDVFVYKNYNRQGPYCFSKIRYLKNEIWKTIILDTIAFICNDKGETVDKVPQKHPLHYYNVSTDPEIHVLDQTSLEYCSGHKYFKGFCVKCGRMFFVNAKSKKDRPQIVLRFETLFMKREEYVLTSLFRYSKILWFSKEDYDTGEPCLSIEYDKCITSLKRKEND